MTDTQPYTHHEMPLEPLNLPSDEFSLQELNILYERAIRQIKELREEVAFLRVQLNHAQVKIIDIDKKRGVEKWVKN